MPTDDSDSDRAPDADNASAPDDTASVGTAASGAAEPDAVETPPISRVPSQPRILWERYRTAIVGAAVGTLLLGLGPIRDWMFGAFDAVHDVAVAPFDYDGHQADTAREQIVARPLWAHKPDVLTKSIDFIGDHPDDSLVTLDGDEPVFVTPEDMVSKGVDYSGSPVILVARVTGVTSLGTDGPLSHRFELQVAGPTAQPIAYAIIGEFNAQDHDYRTGEVVQLLGLVTALGRRKIAGGLDTPTAYFTALDDFLAIGHGPAPKSLLKKFNP